jgi:hypothetical protein
MLNSVQQLHLSDPGSNFQISLSRYKTASLKGASTIFIPSRKKKYKYFYIMV